MQVYRPIECHVDRHMTVMALDHNRLEVSTGCRLIASITSWYQPLPRNPFWAWFNANLAVYMSTTDDEWIELPRCKEEFICTTTITCYSLVHWAWTRHPERWASTLRNMLDNAGPDTIHDLKVESGARWSNMLLSLFRSEELRRDSGWITP